jgi:hypothetical protein
MYLEVAAMSVLSSVAPLGLLLSVVDVVWTNSVPDIDDEKPYTISLVWPLPIPTLTAREIWIFCFKQFEFIGYNLL